ncbi:MAG: hypothetical protein ABGW76_13055 [Mesonia sp.]|uniref:hypothetical protein n=1 Tax=Mesonia sp. TaxID=1960830 RepID=UPI003241CBDC
MNKIILTFSLIIGFNLAIKAQTFNWGYPFGIVDETEKTITHVVEDKLYRVSSYYDLEVFNFEVTADQFSLQDFKKIESLDLSVKQPAMGSAMLTINSVYQQEATDFTFFYTEYNRDLKQRELFWNNVNIDSGEKNDPIKITQQEAKNSFNQGHYYTAQSENKKFYAVLGETYFHKKEKEKIQLLLLDANKKIVKETTFEYDLLDDRNKKQEIFVSNNGEVFIVKKIDLKKQKPFLSVYHWNPASNKMNNYSLKQDDNYQIYDFKMKAIDNEMLFVGLLTHEKSTSIGMKVDMDGRHSGTYAGGILLTRFAADGSLDYMQRNDFTNIVSNLTFNKIIIEDTNAWMISDLSYVEKKSKSTNIAAGNIEYDYNYLNNGFLISYLDTENGELVWNQKIETQEPDTKNDNGAYLSTLAFTANGNLNLLYNETREVRNDRGYKRNRRFPIRHIFSTTGEELSKEAIISAGIGVKYDEDFELNTSILIPVNDNTYILRAKSNSQFKYGYLKL